jgi:hypothetical protein
MPSPLQLRFAVRFTTPLTTCPHAAFDDDACAAPGVPPCCAAAGVAVPIVSVLNVISVINTDAAIMDEILRLPSSSILNQPESRICIIYMDACTVLNL